MSNIDSQIKESVPSDTRLYNAKGFLMLRSNTTTLTYREKEALGMLEPKDQTGVFRRQNDETKSMQTSLFCFKCYC